MVPTLELFQIFGPVSNECAQIVQPRRRIDDVIIVLKTFAYLASERVEPRLMTELLARLGFLRYISRNSLSKIVRRHFLIAWHSFPSAQLL